MTLGAAEQRGPGDEKKDQEEPSDKYHSPEQALLLFNDAERASCEEEAGVQTGDTLHDSRDAYVWLRLPADGVGMVSAEIVEDAAGRGRDGLVQVAVGRGGHALIVVEDDKGLEASLQIDVVAGDGFFGLDAGCDLGGVEVGHLSLGLVGSAAKHVLESEGSGGTPKSEDKTEGESVEEDGARDGLLANHEEMLLHGGFEEISEEMEPEEERRASTFCVGIAYRLEQLVPITQTQARGIEAEGVAVEGEESRVGCFHARTPLGRFLLRAARTALVKRAISAEKTLCPKLVMR